MTTMFDVDMMHVSTEGDEMTATEKKKAQDRARMQRNRKMVAETISAQAEVIDKLIDAVRKIALMDEVDAALDPTWAIRIAGAAWREARTHVYGLPPIPKPTSNQAGNTGISG